MVEFEGLPTASPLQPPIPQLLQRWHDAEPGRFPLTFLGLGWGQNNPYEKEMTSLGYMEFSAALDATSQRAWRLEIYIPGRPASEPSTVLVGATVSDTKGASRTTFASDPLEATVRAVINALHSQDHKTPTGQPRYAAIPFVDEHSDPSNPTSNTSPIDDIRMWARLESNRFEKSGRDRNLLKYRGVGYGVLAPVLRGGVVQH